MRFRSIRTFAVAATFAGLTLSTGCYAPDGGFMPSSNATFTYISTTWSPKTVRVIDTRTDEAFFAITLPVGKQLTFKFLEGKGDDPVMTPDRMQWEIWDAPHGSGKLSNQLTCPPSMARRIQVDVRPGPEDPPAIEDYRLRLDESEDRPDYWTPKGGEIPGE
ncbi:MAG: hypothetical protein CMJ23_12275 [Phycisphaerae bacterium]|nr:hypothetical protein [Phycisphaerae bacterium]